MLNPFGIHRTCRYAFWYKSERESEWVEMVESNSHSLLFQKKNHSSGAYEAWSMLVCYDGNGIVMYIRSIRQNDCYKWSSGHTNTHITESNVLQCEMKAADAKRRKIHVKLSFRFDHLFPFPRYKWPFGLCHIQFSVIVCVCVYFGPAFRRNNNTSLSSSGRVITFDHVKETALAIFDFDSCHYTRCINIQYTAIVCITLM